MLCRLEMSNKRKSRKKGRKITENNEQVIKAMQQGKIARDKDISWV